MSELIRADGPDGQRIDFWPEGAYLMARLRTPEGIEDIYRVERLLPPPDPNPNGRIATILGVYVSRAPGGACIIPEEEAIRRAAAPFAALRARCLNAVKNLKMLRNLEKRPPISPDRTVQELWDAVRQMVSDGHAAQGPETPPSGLDYPGAFAAVERALAWCNETEAFQAKEGTKAGIISPMPATRNEPANSPPAAIGRADEPAAVCITKSAAGNDVAGLELIPGGFAYRGETHDLTGKPRDMLESLLQSRHRRLTAADLREPLGVDEEAVEYPEQVVKDTAKLLRRALAIAVSAAGLTCDDPLPSLGKGKDLTYTLAMP